MEDSRIKPNNSAPVSFLRSSLHFRLLGFVPLTFFLIQAIHYWRTDELGHLLWMCNVGNLLLAIGLFLEHTVLIRVVVLWMVPGFVIWVLYVVAAWGMFFSSTLAHAGGLAVALLIVRRVGMDKTAWLYALGWYLVIQVISRFVTPPALNVNVAHSIYPGWEQTFTAYWQFWLVLTAVVAISLWLVGWIFVRLHPDNDSVGDD